MANKFRVTTVKEIAGRQLIGGDQIEGSVVPGMKAESHYNGGQAFVEIVSIGILDPLPSNSLTKLLRVKIEGAAAEDLIGRVLIFDP